MPLAAISSLEHLFVVSGRCRFKQEHFDECACFLPEMQTCLNDFGVIEYHQSSWAQVFRKIVKNVFANFTMPIYQQFGCVPLFQRELRNPIVGKRIVVVADVNMSCFCHVAI